MTTERFNYVAFDGFEDNGKELSAYDVLEILNELHEENQILRHELLCKQLDKAPTEPINCKCHYEVKE